MKMRKLLLALALLTAIFLGAKLYWNSLISVPNPKVKEEKLFVISKGEAAASVAERLQKEGLIKSSLAFRILLKTSNKGALIQAGSFKLSPSMSAEEVIKELKTGLLDKWVTILEGWRVEEIAEKLNSEFRIQNSEFLKAAKEGYMFPDTYLFNVEATAKTIAQTMEANFDKKYDGELQSKIKKQGLTPDEGVILASIVEREARSQKVRQMVASILLKRLKIGMGLNADATVQYALGYQRSEKSWWKRNLTYEDLKFESPYNTYLYRGLPPAPIANPSLSSLQAVAEADSSTSYLYYYHDSKGNSYYAEDLEEHNENVTNHP